MSGNRKGPAELPGPSWIGGVDLLGGLKVVRVFVGAGHGLIGREVRIVRKEGRQLGRIGVAIGLAGHVAGDVLTNAGLNVINVRMPFPGSGQQKKFETEFARALQLARFS